MEKAVLFINMTSIRTTKRRGALVNADAFSRSLSPRERDGERGKELSKLRSVSSRSRVLANATASFFWSACLLTTSLGSAQDLSNKLPGWISSVAFSPDGKRSVYLAQHSDNLVAVVDGKEAYTVETVTTGRSAEGLVQGIDQSPVHDIGEGRVQHQFLISQSGAHIACVTEDANNLSHVFLDGAKSQDYRTVDLGQVAFVGENLVYAAQTGDDKWHMFVNNRPGPAYDSVKSLELSDDNRHYAFIGGMNGGNSVVVADGVPGTPRPGGGLGIHGLVIASNGRVAYLGYTLIETMTPPANRCSWGINRFRP